jgi:hypothetical protein
MQVSAAFPGGRPPGNSRATAGHGTGFVLKHVPKTGGLAYICILQINPGDKRPGFAHGLLLYRSAVIRQKMLIYEDEKTGTRFEAHEQYIR